MKSIEAGPGAAITPHEVAWVRYKLTERGLYEYRDIGEDEAAGFFVIDGTFGRGLRSLDRSQALVPARMKDGA